LENKLNEPLFVIAIAGHSGAGKSTVIENLVAVFGDAISLRLDDYESSSIYPPASQWLDEGADPNQFLTPALVEDVKTLIDGRSISHPRTNEVMKPERYLMIEEPFGRERNAMRALIDFVVYIDTPLEVAYARKLLRKNEFLPWEDNPSVFITNLRENLLWYLRVGRRFYGAVSSNVKKNCDLIVDGTLSTEEIVKEIYEAVIEKQGVAPKIRR
jgi:uridine kinase